MKATTVEHQKKLYESKHRITSIFDFISKYGMVWSVFILLLPLMMTRGKFVKTQPTLPKITASLGRTRFSLKWVISWLGVILQLDEGTQAFLPRPNQTIYIFILNKKTAGYKLGKQLCIFQVWVTIWTNQEAGEYLGYHVLVAHPGQNGEYWFLWSSIRWENF